MAIVVSSLQPYHEYNEQLKYFVSIGTPIIYEMRTNHVQNITKVERTIFLLKSARKSPLALPIT